MTAAVRIIIAEDSALFAEALVQTLSDEPGFEVVGVARDGRAAVEMTERLRPDIVLMDVLMPVMNGIDAIATIMERTPTPILVLSADPRGYSGELSIEALRRGALDVRAKPERWRGTPGEQQALRQHVRLLASVPTMRRARPGLKPQGAVQRRPSHPPPPGPSTVEPAATVTGPRIQAMGIVASTGGPAALATLLRELPAELGAGIAIVQHLAPGFLDQVASWLRGACALEVRVAKVGDRIEPGLVMLAPDNVHLQLDGRGRVRLLDRAPVHGHRPSGTLLLQSLAESYGAAAAGVVLTGMGDDGAAGLLALRKAGGLTLAQEESSCAVFGMPRAALECGAAMRMLSLPALAEAMARAAGSKEAPPA